MIAWLIIYIVGVVLVGGVFAWFIKETEEEVSLFDLIRMVSITLVSWASVVLFIVIVVSTWIEDYSCKVIIKKGKKEDEE